MPNKQHILEQLLMFCDWWIDWILTPVLNDTASDIIVGYIQPHPQRRNRCSWDCSLDVTFSRKFLFLPGETGKTMRKPWVERINQIPSIALTVQVDSFGEVWYRLWVPKLIDKDGDVLIHRDHQSRENKIQNYRDTEKCLWSIVHMARSKED